MRKLGFITSVIGVVALACFAAPAAYAAGAAPRDAAAAARPAATFRFKYDRVNHGVKPIVIYSTSHLPAKPVIYLQRQFGSARVWENVEKLKYRNGTVTAPGVELGKYGYRLRVTNRRKVVVTSATRTLYSYGTVPISALCADYYGGSCSSATVQIGNTIFTYVMADGDYGYPSYGTELQFSSTSCDSLTVTFGTDDTTSGAEAYEEVIQSRSDPQYGSTGIDTIGTFRASLDGGPFYLEDSETNGYTVYENGSASCYTPSGLK